MSKKVTTTKITKTYVLPETGQVVEAESAVAAVDLAKKQTKESK